MREELLEELFEAIWDNNIDKVKELVENNADVNAKDEWGDTALIKAARYDRKEIAEILIKAGADLNIKNKYGCTALIIAAWMASKEVAKILTKAGANHKKSWKDSVVKVGALFDSLISLFITLKATTCFFAGDNQLGALLIVAVSLWTISCNGLKIRRGI